MGERRARGVTPATGTRPAAGPTDAGKRPRAGSGAGVAGADPQLRALADGLHSVAIHLLRRVRREDEAMGLSPARASVLSVLVFGGARSLRELAEAEQVSAPTMSRMVAGMEAVGLVRRRVDPADARSLRLDATTRGRRILEAGRARRVERLAQMLEPVSAEDRAMLAQAVAVLESRVREPAAPAPAPNSPAPPTGARRRRAGAR